MASHFFQEFKSKLDLNLEDPQYQYMQHQQTMMSQQQTNPRMAQYMANNRSQQLNSIDGRGDQMSQTNKRFSNMAQSIERRFNREESVNQEMLRMDDSRTVAGGMNNTFSREESPNTKFIRNYPQQQNTFINEESGQLASQYKKIVSGAISHSVLKRSNIQNYTNNNENSQDQAYYSQNGSRKQVQQSGGNLQQNTQRGYQKIEQIQEEIRMQERQRRGFLRVGDLVCLIFNEKVFDGDFNKDDKEQKKNTQLAKITETPEMVYRGVMCSDGVTNKGFNVIPKSTDFLFNGSAQFKKCLFRLEIAQECDYNMIHQSLQAELAELEGELDEIDDSNYDALMNQIQDVERKIKDNNKMLREEIKNNEYEFKMNLGKKITYGQKIMLRHEFSQQFLTLNTKRASLEHGCVGIQLSDPNEDSWFQFAPSQKIRQNGQSISYQDSFYLQNFVQDIIEKPRFFVHVNTNDIERQKEESILEVNGSHEPTRFRARLFIDYNHLLNEKLNVHSGDSIRLFHKESNGFLTVNEKDIDSILPQFPDFLQKQIKTLTHGQRRMEGDQKDDDDDHKIIEQQEEDKVQQKNRIFIENDPECLLFTNSCWEIQKVKAFKGGSIFYDDYYRIKHIGTGKFLSMTPDKQGLTLKPYADSSDTLFRLRKDSFQPSQNNFDGEVIQTENLIILESFNRTYIQIYQDFENEDHERFLHKVKSAYHKYSNDSLQSQIPLVCGFFAKEDVSKMVFIVQEVPKEEALISYQGSSFFEACLQFYKFLNDWAVDDIDEEEDSYDKKKYDGQTAIATEQELMQNVEDFQQVIYYLHMVLRKANELSKDNYLTTQQNLAEQGILHILIKTIELIYYKTVPFVERELPFLSAKQRRERRYGDDNEAEQIAREYLDPLAERILKIIHLLIKQNSNNANIMTKYDNVIYTALMRYDTKIVASIFKETYKRATYIHGDKSAAITNSEGLNLKVIEANGESAASNQFNSSFTNQINKWAEMLESVSWVDERDENISKQILYLNVISMICRDQEGRGVFHYQIQAVNNILASDQTVPLKFQIQKREQDKVAVYFVRKLRETGEFFFQKNPMLKEIFKQSTTAYRGDHFDITFELQEISAKADHMMPYIDYICAVIDLYSNICLSRNTEGIKKVKELGLNQELIINCISSKNINEKIKASFIQAARVLFIDNDPFPSIINYKNRCYFWNSIGEVQAHRTMYKWEKEKYIFPQQNRIIAQQNDGYQEAAFKIRALVSEFFQKGPSDIVEFLYGHVRKTYTKRELDPKLKLLLHYMESATSLIQCEHVDASFIYRMLKTSALIFLSYNVEVIPEEQEKSWITRFLKVAKTQKGCRNKIELLEEKTLKMLQVICSFRLNSQVLLFLKLFKKSYDKNDLPIVTAEQTYIDSEFSVLFQLYQFGIDKNSTLEMVERLQKNLQDDFDYKNNKKILELNDIQLSDDEIFKFDDPNKQNINEKKIEDEESKKKNQEIKEKQTNKKFAIYQFLLYLIFKKTQNQKIRNEAVKVLVMNFKQRQSLMDEIIKIELLISDQDQKDYQEFKFQTYRLTEHIEQIVHDDLYYLLYQNIDKEKYKKCIKDVQDILRGMTQSLKTDYSRLHKKQNMLRHLDVANDLINRLMKNIQYKGEHFDLFLEISNFLFMYSYRNSNNQRTLLPHLNYIVSLVDKNIPTTKLISQIISQHKNTEEGVDFLEFLSNKLVRENHFKSFILNLLSIMTYDNPSNQIIILKRLIKKKRFRKRLYFDEDKTHQKKVELLIQFKKQINQMQIQKPHKNDENWERIQLHLQTVDLLSSCARNSMYGIMQARKLINIEFLFDSILSEAIPFLFKKYYFRLLFEVYINDVRDVSSMDLNSQRFIDVLKFIILDDLRQYYLYYLGLLKKIPPDARRDTEQEKERDIASNNLEKLSSQQAKNPKQYITDLETHKDQKSKISTLKYTKPFPLINDSDFNEYWKYLSHFSKSQNKADGLLHFIKDFYSNIQNSHFKMKKELVEITISIKEILTTMSDDLHKIHYEYKKHLIDINQLIFEISEAQQSIPNVKTFKAGRKFKVQGGGGNLNGGEDDEAQIVTEESQIEELDDSKMLDIRMASDNILRIVRDHIISNNCQIREAFGINSIETNIHIKKFELKNKIKNIAGNEATYEEIDKAIQFFMDFSKEQQQEKKILQVEIGQEGHIKPRQDPSSFSADTHINFRDFEILLKKILTKHGYKPVHQKRERNIEEELKFKMADEQLSQACNDDLKLYSKCFFDFCQKFKNNDELKDLVTKISEMFNTAFEKNQTETIKEFVENMIQGFVNSDHKIYLMKILNMILEQYMPSNYDDDTSKEVLIVAKKRLYELQIQDELLQLMKTNKQQLHFFEYIKERLINQSDKMIKDLEKRLYLQHQEKQKRESLQSEQAVDQTALEETQKLNNLNQQPFYFVQNYDLESELEKLKKNQFSNELINILKLIQLLCDNCHAGFQNYLVNQEENGVENQQVSSLYETVEQLFDTLIDFLYGPCEFNQEILGNWKKFCKAINFYLSQDMGYYAPNTTEAKAKLTILSQCGKLLIALIESDKPEFKKSIMSEMANEIKLKNLKTKMVEIFSFKIGGDDHKLRYYLTDKICQHYKNQGVVRLNMCEKDEFCQYGHLIKFDKKIITAGFNIFIFLYIFKEVLPTYKELQDCDFDLKNDELYQQNKFKWKLDLKKETQITIQKHQQKIEKDAKEKQDEIDRKTEEILQQMALLEPSKRMFKVKEDQKKKKEKVNLNQGIDNDQIKSNTDGLLGEGGPNDTGDSLTRKQTISRKQTMKQKKKKNKYSCSRNCCVKSNPNLSCFTKFTHAIVYCTCCTCCRKNRNHNRVNIEGQDIMNEEDTQSEDENENTQFMQKKDDKKKKYIHQEEKRVLQKSLQKQYNNEEVYSLDQFKLETAIRFYVSNVASIEINYNGQLVKMMYRIPSFCNFMSESIRKEVIYGADRTGQSEKLEDFFSKINVIKAEMKSVQRLARRSSIQKWFATKWAALSNVSFFIICLINLLFIIFYEVDPNEDKIIFSYESAQYVIDFLGIVQAFISFIVVVTYFQKFHGVIHQRYLEQTQEVHKRSITDLKGSMGFSYGQQAYKLSTLSNINIYKQCIIDEDINILQSNSKFSKKNKNENKKERFEALIYIIKTFFIGLRDDIRHQFNTLYFIISIAGIFYHTMFSFLLLEIIVKIPLLTSVVQAISQNQKQIIYTLILLFVIIYIYSFLAFQSLRDDYINNEMPDEDPDYNGYCQSLILCFTSTLNNGLRSGGGIGDVLKQLGREDRQYWARWVFDLSFFIVIIILLLNLIFGIIIDAFADMRDQRNMIEKDVKEKCFICGINRSAFEARNKSFQDHVNKEHNVYAYIYFILYLQRKPGNECTGVEKYVRNLVFMEDPLFFPINTCLTLSTFMPKNDNQVQHNEL